MKVVILAQKYKCGCGKGIHHAKYPGLVETLNTIMEWDLCEWPEKEKGVQDKEFLGNPPQLEPGNCILWDGNVIALDDMDTAILIVTETGPFAITRFIDAVKNEVVFSDEVKKITISESEKEKPEEPGCFRLGYDMWKVFKDKYKQEKEVCLSVMDEETLIFPITVWVDKQSIWFDQGEVEKETIEDLSISIYNYLINKKEEGN